MERRAFFLPPPPVLLEEENCSFARHEYILGLVTQVYQLNRGQLESVFDGEEKVSLL